jgi:Tfp pilus assembly protein PilE
MNNKGFVFVETIIVITVLSVALITIYSSFSTVLSNEKKRSAYDDTAYIYETYYIEDYLVSLNLKQYVDHYLVENGRNIITFTCNDFSLYQLTMTDTSSTNNVIINDAAFNKESFCEDVFSKLKNHSHIKMVYITPFDVRKLKKCIEDSTSSLCPDEDRKAINNATPNMLQYIRTITLPMEETDPDYRANGDYSDMYRVIVEYEEKTYDYQITANKLKSGNCPFNYENVNDTCIKFITKNYYNNVKLVMDKDKGEKNE